MFKNITGTVNCKIYSIWHKYICKCFTCKGGYLLLPEHFEKYKVMFMNTAAHGKVKNKNMASLQAESNDLNNLGYVAGELGYQRNDPCPPPPPHINPPCAKCTRGTFGITWTEGGGRGGFYDLTRNLGSVGAYILFPLYTDTNQHLQMEVIFKVRALAWIRCK